MFTLVYCTCTYYTNRSALVLQLTRKEIDLRSVSGTIPAHIIIQIERASTVKDSQSCIVRMAAKGVDPPQWFQPLLNIAPAHTSPSPLHKVVALVCCK